jgi:hypothetical protein
MYAGIELPPASLTRPKSGFWKLKWTNKCFWAEINMQIGLVLDQKLDLGQAENILGLGADPNRDTKLGFYTLTYMLLQNFETGRKELAFELRNPAASLSSTSQNGFFQGM